MIVLRHATCVAVALIGLGYATADAWADSGLLQTIDLNHLNMSGEGGEAKLYRGERSCQIAVVHYGEMGKMTYRFVFGRALEAAEQQEFAYAEPLGASATVESTLRRTVNLASPEGRASLPGEFQTYKAMFDPGRLAICGAAAK